MPGTRTISVDTFEYFTTHFARESREARARADLIFMNEQECAGLYAFGVDGDNLRREQIRDAVSA